MNVPTIKQYPVSPDRIPQEIVSAGKYEIRMANTLEELDQILALRYRVFNVEMGEGLESSEATQRDLDDFDAQCHHLMVCLRDTGEVVGTYRMQTRCDPLPPMDWAPALR